MSDLKTTVLATLAGLFTASASGKIVVENGHETPNQKVREYKFEQKEKSDTVADFNKANTTNPKILNIGDSRTVGMYFSQNKDKYSNAVNTTDVLGNQWFAKVGQGLKWFKDNFATLQKYAKNNDIIVINLGINDLSILADSKVQAEKYLKLLNELADDLSKDGKVMFFSSVNPVGPQYKNYRLFNKKIDDFNQYMREGVSDKIYYIDTNSYIKDKLQYKCFDKYGLHYTSSINKSIYSYIEESVYKQWKNIKGNNLMHYYKTQQREL